MTNYHLKLIGTWFAIIAIGSSAASACNIPVFRYALERWQSDRFQVIVYHSGSLAADQEQTVQQLEHRSFVAGGPLNIEVIRYDVSGSAPKLLDAMPPSAESDLPIVEVRARDDRVGWVRRWQGPLADAVAEAGVFNSPARDEIVRRILSGDAAVWLLIAADKDQADNLGKSLDELLQAAAAKLPPPQGIGQPGSELYATVPLELRFSVLSISRSDPAEQRLLEMIATSAKDWQADGTYVVPIYGRGRALDVLPHSDLDPEFIDEIAGFICGACSCQVKQANPGFDLLVSVNWEEKLFGATSPDIEIAEPTRSSTPNPDSTAEPAIKTAEPEYVAIPSGSAAGEGSRSATSPAAKIFLSLFAAAITTLICKKLWSAAI